MNSTLSLAPPAPRPLPALLRSLQADVLKLRHTSATRLAIGAAVVPVLLVFLSYYFYGTTLVKPGHTPWASYLLDAWRTWATLILPLLLLLLATLVVQIEHRANAWKHLYALPTGRNTLLLSKWLLLLGLSLLTQVLYTALLLLAGWALGRLRPGLGFQQAVPPLGVAALWLARTYVATLGLLTVQFVASVAWRSFVGPMALGLAGFVASLIVQSLSPAGWLPYADSLLTLRTVHPTATGLVMVPHLASHEWTSLLWALAGGLLGLLWLGRRPGGA